jgi:hypothetical protein
MVAPHSAAAVSMHLDARFAVRARVAGVGVSVGAGDSAGKDSNDKGSSELCSGSMGIVSTDILVQDVGWLAISASARHPPNVLNFALPDVTF